MLTPKSSHLVERAAQRLLQSGTLEESAAHMLVQPAGEASRTPPGDDPTPASPALAVHAPALHATASHAPIHPSPAAAALTPSGSTASDVTFPDGPASASDPDPWPAPTAGSAATTPALPVPQNPAQAGVLRQPSNPPVRPERPADPPRREPAPLHPSLPTNPGANLAQGAASIDTGALERAGMIDWSRTRTRISEEFRLVQRQIIRTAFGPGSEPGFSNLLMVTSARPGEGKSFVATNLAGSIARQGDHPVLLVDADSKRDSICYGLGLAQARGLLDLAADPRLDPNLLIVKTPIERLTILPVGRERERSAELFSIKAMTRLIQSLGRRYADRLLILDAPPCLSTSDPAVLAQVVGQILFVVEADRTQREEVEASLDLIQACPSIAMVLNKQQGSSRYTFGAYSSYYAT